MVRLGEQKFTPPAVSYAEARAAFRRLKVATSALQRILIRHHTAARTFFKWKYLSKLKHTTAAPPSVPNSNIETQKQKLQQFRIGLSFLTRILRQRIKRNMILKFKKWKRICQHKRLIKLRRLVMKKQIKAIRNSFNKWSLVQKV